MSENGETAETQRVMLMLMTLDLNRESFDRSLDARGAMAGKWPPLS